MRVFGLLAGLLLVTPVTAAGADTEHGAFLYVAKGCLGCHGAGGRGGVGPALATLRLGEAAALEQLRHPRGVMPAVPAAVVDDADAHAIFAYLERVPPPPPPLRGDLPHGALDLKTCAPCHARVTPEIVRQFEASAMGRPGVQNPRVQLPLSRLTCANCHGTDHDEIMASQGRVPETVCGACHQQIYREHVLDAGHSYGPGPRGLGINWERNISGPAYGQLPRKATENGCDPCHAQAGATDAKYWSEERKQYVDPSSLTIRNGCAACHTRHAFSLDEARRPEACSTCHTGPDNPTYAAYMSSQHGSIYAARGKTWDWREPLAQARWDAPTCAYCHMLYVDAAGVRSASHNMTRKIVWGMGVPVTAGLLPDLAAQPEGEVKRVEMIKVCLTCHSEVKARQSLEAADAHKLLGDALVLEAREILAGLYRDRLIRPSHGRAAAGLHPGGLTAVDLPDGLALHSPTGLFGDVSPVEREYFALFFFSALRSYKGAFHMSPVYAWWYGYADLLGHLAAIREAAQALRAAEAVRERTLLLVVAGSLLLLAVLGAVWAGSRLRRRRRA
jgi:hydroxylamine dehydrogenase